jgi:hypothetical protein
MPVMASVSIVNLPSVPAGAEALKNSLLDGNFRLDCIHARQKFHHRVQASTCEGSVLLLLLSRQETFKGCDNCWLAHPFGEHMLFQAKAAQQILGRKFQ